MTEPTPSITVAVDPTNPGQFFACCGLLELADRLWPDAEGWFSESGKNFKIACEGTLPKLLEAAQQLRILDESTTDDEDTADGDDDDGLLVPVEIVAPISLRLDWWANKSIKTWAGSMNVHRITEAMAGAVDPARTDPLQQRQIVYDPPPPQVDGVRRSKSRKKREPFYFDSDRGPNAHSRDVGFSPNDLKLTTTASPAVELLALVGLQRHRPMPTATRHEFDYFLWTTPLPIAVAPAAACGMLADSNAPRFRFRNVFRSGQKKLKVFMPAILTTPKGA